MHKLFGGVGDQNFFDQEREIEIYTRDKKSLKKSSNITLELFVISKQWVREWKHYVDFLQGVAANQERVKPGPINASIKSNETFLLTYPKNHVYNQKIIELQPEDYVLVSDAVLNLWKKSYGVDQEMRRQVRFNESGQIISSINLRKVQNTIIQQYVYFKIDLTYKGIVQVDEGCKIKMWKQLLLESLRQQFKVEISGIRMWRHKTYNADIAIKQLEEHKGQFNGEILDENLYVNDYPTDLIIIDIESKGTWQYTYLDQKVLIIAKLQISYKEEFKYIYEKAIKGCGKYHCDRNYCASNPVFSQIGFQKKELQIFLVELFREENIDWKNVCWNQIREQQPIQQLNGDVVVPLTALSNFPESFGASFLENPREQYEVNVSDPELNGMLIQKIDNSINYNILNQWIDNLFKKARSSVYLVRAIFVILNFSNFFKIVEQTNLLMESIVKLSNDQKNLLTQFVGFLSDDVFTRYVEVLKKNIGAFLTAQRKKPVQLLTKAEIQFITQQLEFLQIFYNSNKVHKRIQKTKFIIPEISIMYPKYGDQLEYHQFDGYIQKDQEKYYFTFCKYPWAMSLDFKNDILALESRFSQRISFEMIFTGGQMPINLFIDRNDVVGSALQGLGKYGKGSLKGPLKVSFIGEQGVDQGGLTREFFSLLMQKLFDLNYGMFVARNNNTVLWFNQQSVEMPIQFELIGKILGLALYNQVLLDIKFPQLVFKKLMDEPTTIEDLKELDLDIYKGLNNIAEYEKEDLEQALSLNFTVTFTDCWGEIVTQDLIPNGNKIPVTQQNKHEYIKMCTNYYLHNSIKQQFMLFKEGFWKVAEGNGIKLFTGEELQCLIVGQPNFDLAELEASTVYDGFDPDSEYIRIFWAFIHSLEVEQQKQFLFFCTGSDRVPVGGLKSLKFVIQKQGEDTEQLPSSHTCFNVFLLPQYSSTEKMIVKMQIALQNCEGFGLI